jgi:hypothetical protein
MSRNWARVIIASALVTLIAGVSIASSGNSYGWLLAAIGAVNTVLGFVLLRKSADPLS